MKKKRKKKRKEEVGLQLPTISEEETEIAPKRMAATDVSNSFGNGVDPTNLSRHRVTNTEEKALRKVEL